MAYLKCLNLRDNKVLRNVRERIRRLGADSTHRRVRILHIESTDHQWNVG